MNKEKIIRCLEENGVQVLENGELDNLNSFNFISALVSIEQEFEVEIPDQYLTSAILNNLEIIENIIMMKNEKD